MKKEYKIKIINILQRVSNIKKGRLIVGAFLFLLGVTFNESLLTRILSEDGSINFQFKFMIWLFDIITIGFGIILLSNVTFSINKIFRILQKSYRKITTTRY